ncbi:transcription factor MYB1R1-like [Bidens hawaiensis]|uniref:transcription factor MYB1R1-like n=1 Tax=Bidens hawaiensis TaxID=980011 RepID=UPI00404A488B
MSQRDGCGTGEIMLFGVRVKVDPMRKCVSLNNLSQYQQPDTRVSSNNINLDVSAGYASANESVRNQSNSRKRGIPWNEDEHKLFLQGLQKVGKGDWRGISRNFVKTRTPTQVASHAQKYFLRQSNLNRRRRRSSLFDITTDSVTAMQTEEQVNDDQVNGGSMRMVFPVNTVPTANPSTGMDLDQNQYQNLNPQYEADSDYLNLSLTYNPNRSSSNKVISGFNNGDGMIRVN